MAKTGTLYLVATPIGNLSDLSPRALQVLQTVDVIAAEDTRVTRKLCAHFDLHKPLISYYEHNRMMQGEKILARLQAGEDVALVSDAGTPGISDPGEELTRLCVDAGVTLVPVPGACAAVAALIVSGLPTNRFAFEGFLSTAKASRRERLISLKNEPRTLIFYEAPHRLTQTLSDLQKHLGDREMALCKELTKLNEKVVRGTIGDVRALFDEKNAPRGEYVLVVAGEKAQESPFWTALSVEEHIQGYRAQGLSQKEAIRAVAADRGVSKNEIYMHFVKKEAAPER